MLKGLIFAALITVQLLADEDVLEPSIQNEVDHALAIAPAVTNLAPCVVSNLLKTASNGDFFATNELSRTALAIRLVSTQRRDGRWFIGTNDVTFAALEILRSL